MTRQSLAAFVVVTFGAALSVMAFRSQSQPPVQGPSADRSPAWLLQAPFPDPTGRTIVDAAGRVTIPPRNNTPPVPSAVAPASVVTETPPCRRSPLCGKRNGVSRQSLQRVQWKQTMGYTFTYPYALPPGF